MDLKLTSILGNSQKLDGGAMFGNAPKALWQRWVNVDDANRIDLACRALLVEQTHDDGSVRRILFETGIGAFFEPKLARRYGVVEADHRLLVNLASHDLSDADIDVVVLSHLHFDHAGGLLSAWSPDAEPTLLFPNATFLVGAAAWERAQNPHPRDRASFLPDLNAQLAGSGRLVIADGPTSDVLGEGFTFHLSHGHTPGLLLTEISTATGPLLFAGDLIPAAPWVHVPITMGYDRFPELLIDEKTAVLGDLLGRGGRLFLTHDPQVAVGTVAHDGRRYHLTETLPELS